MAKEYIDREAVVNILNRHSYIANEPPMDKYDYAVVKELYSIKEEIKNTASADVAEVHHGEWYLQQNDEGCGFSYFCSECFTSYFEEDFYEYGEYVPFNYCPHCGAKMDRKSEEENEID